jgi:hypothetical protein
MPHGARLRTALNAVLIWLNRRSVLGSGLTDIKALVADRGSNDVGDPLAPARLRPSALTRYRIGTA